MSRFNFELQAEPREALGKGASRRLRHHHQLIPAIVYGANQEPQTVSLGHKEVLKALENEAIFSHILTLSLNGQKQKVVLKDLQRHPYKPKVLHMDLMRVNPNQLIIMHIPLRFLGQETAPGVVVDKGIVTHHMVELEVKCLPKDLPEFIEIDLSNAPLDTVVHLSQISLPKGVELTSIVHGSEDDLPVVSIHKPKRLLDETSSVEATENSEASEESKGE